MKIKSPKIILAVFLITACVFLLGTSRVFALYRDDIDIEETKRAVKEERARIELNTKKESLLQEKTAEEKTTEELSQTKKTAEQTLSVEIKSKALQKLKQKKTNLSPEETKRLKKSNTRKVIGMVFLILALILLLRKKLSA